MIKMHTHTDIHTHIQNYLRLKCVPIAPVCAGARILGTPMLEEPC